MLVVQRKHQLPMASWVQLLPRTAMMTMIAKRTTVKRVCQLFASSHEGQRHILTMYIGRILLNLTLLD